MGLATPSYLRAANLQDDTIRYKWDDWDEGVSEEPIDGELYARLRALSQRANVAFTIASAEWVVHRFGQLMDDTIPLQHLEAAWAQLIDHAYSFAWDFTDVDPWSGPIKRPVMRAMGLVTAVINEMAVDGDPSMMAAIISKLAEHVISDPKPYRSWRERVLQRLERLYPLDPEEKIGEVVPRQALDPDFDFKPEQTQTLVNKFLAGLDYDYNGLLNAPETMLAEGFHGTPYVFDIEADRRMRFEW